MSWFKNIFGDSKAKGGAPAAGGSSARSKSSSPPPPDQNAKQEGIENMARIDEQIGLIEKRIEHHELQLKEEEEKVKAILRECGTDEKKKERKKPELLRHMQHVKRIRQQIDDDEKKKLNFMTMRDTLQKSVEQVDEVKTMSAAAKTMKKLVQKESVIEDLRADLEETMEDQVRAQELLTEQFATGVTVDEDDLAEFMGSYEDEAAAEAVQQQAALPEVPHPQVALPAAGKKQLPKKQSAAEAAAAEAQEELDRIAASM